MTSKLALTRARPAIQAASTTGSTARIPAFLNKLYEMVNDQKTNHLIEWAQDGDSFFVHNQEQFAREVLPHWFKHQNFASFVRQLNMYGFHKVPHLQQGVLKSDAEVEFWNFEHTSFRRGQPDLLCLIQRKKGPANAPEEDKGDAATAGLPVISNGQTLDLQSIVNGISSIKRHQTAISNELSELRQSNELLWKESEAARARHQKQQDTINRIVKFLAGVFGSHVSKDDVASSPSPSSSRVVVPRRKSRLMIEGSSIEPNVESPAPFANIETPGSAIEPGSPKGISATFDSPIATPVTLTPQTNTDIVAVQPEFAAPSSMGGYSILPSRSPGPELDAMVQNALSTMTPAQIQQLVETMNIAPYDFGTSGSHQNMGESSVMAYNPVDMSQFTAPYALLDSPQPQPANFLEKVDHASKATSDVQHKVDAVDSSINNLFSQFQLPGDGSLPMLDTTSLAGADSTSGSELFSDFFNNLDDSDDTVPSNAFLDEIAASDGTRSPVDEILPSHSVIKGKKRKSNAGADSPAVDPSSLALLPDSRSKRRKER
ncbi:Transcriptional factor [Mycena kentingensis (nom. inval.)]|nr:Transcriptional factor [Mycena kentingensis (nom. inval.)]